MSTTPTTPPTPKYQPQLDSFKRRQTLTERDRNSGPGLGGRRWELVGAEHLRVTEHQRTAKHEHADDGTDKDACELGKKLLTRVRAKQVAALQVGEQVGR